MNRSLKAKWPSIEVTDGGGVKINRNIVGGELAVFDPFLMLDEIYLDDPEDYIKGFPEHPHRGFQTLTYMLSGKMFHRDHLGNEGVLNSGDVQWMTAGRGVLHSEMPFQDRGRLHGFQIWINLPAREKMIDPNYLDIRSEKIPVVEFGKKSFLKIIAGSYSQNNHCVLGAISGVTVEPEIFDISINNGDELNLPADQRKNVLIYVYGGGIKIEEQFISKGQLGILGEGDQVRIYSDMSSRLLLLSGIPLKEPIANWGPFVMNSTEEINRAILDFRSGSFAVKK